MSARKKKIKKNAKKRNIKGISRPKSSTESDLLVKVRFLVVSGKDEMKVSRSIDAYIENITESGILFQTTSMNIDKLHLSYEESPLLRNKLIVEIELPNQAQRIKALAEVAWYERSLVSQEEVFHVGANFKEMSDEDRALIKTFLVQTNKIKESISIE